MKRSLFLAIIEKVCTYDSYFVQKSIGLGVVGPFSRQKLITVLCMLALGVCADAMDEYCRISETIALNCMK
jgi:hypothetical protein